MASNIAALSSTSTAASAGVARLATATAPSPDAGAQLTLEDLARGVAGEAIDELDVLGDLEGRELPAQVVGQLSLGHVGFAHDERGDGLDPLLVRDADDGHLGDGGVGVERVLDLTGGDEDAARVDDVLDAVDDEDVALLVDADEVAGVEPAVGEGVLGRGGVVPVAVAQLG